MFSFILQYNFIGEFYVRYLCRNMIKTWNQRLIQVSILWKQAKDNIKNE